MIDTRKLVLVGDPDEERFKWLQELLEKKFLVRAGHSDTFYSLLALIRKHEPFIIAVFICDDLWFSPDTKIDTAGLFHMLHSFQGERCCIVTKDKAPDLGGVIKAPRRIYIPGFYKESGEKVLSELDRLEYLPRKPLPPGRRLARDDRILREQLRLLNDDRSLDGGLDEITELVSRIFKCEEVIVNNLGQGKSGAKVFRITPKMNGAGIGEYVLKLCPSNDWWKIHFEVGGHSKAKPNLTVGNYLGYVAGICRPDIPHDEEHENLKYVVSSNKWYAVCYNFLGGEPFGKTIDLETALIASPDELRVRLQGNRLGIECQHSTQIPGARKRVLEVMLEWLCRSWYENKKLIKRESKQLWNPEDAQGRQYFPMPPYQFTGRNKGYILSFLDSHYAEMGARFFPRWKSHCNSVGNFIERTKASPSTRNLIDRELPIVLSPAHGDLNANNILLWLEHRDPPFLIDFPMYQESGHALQDFARLEVEIKFALMDKQQGSLPALDHTYTQLPLWKQMEDHLLSDNWHTAKEWKRRGFKENVNLCLELVHMVRGSALRVYQQDINGTAQHDFFEEYLPALLFHTVRAIGFDTLSPFKRLLAVYSAASLLKWCGVR